MATPTSYATFIGLAKKHANQGESHRLALMQLLLDTEPRTSIWHDNPDKLKNWDALLQREGLCTPSLYHAFKRATKLVNVDVFGVYASASIANLPADHRPKIITTTQRWIKSHAVPPTYQRISKYVRETRAKVVKPKAKVSKGVSALTEENNRLKAYIRLLQRKLHQHKIPVPLFSKGESK